MNNTTTKRNLALVAIFMAATLVVVTFATTTTIATTQSAFAYPQKKKGGGDENSKNGNTVTIEKCKQDGTVSGFDNTAEQECQNVICTHPGNNATCVQEGATTAAASAQAPKTCEQCFTSLLTQDEIRAFLRLTPLTSIADVCTLLEVGTPAGHPSESGLIRDLQTAGVSIDTSNQLIACLKEAGIVFRP